LFYSRSKLFIDEFTTKALSLLLNLPTHNEHFGDLTIFIHYLVSYTFQQYQKGSFYKLE